MVVKRVLAPKLHDLVAPRRVGTDVDALPCSVEVSGQCLREQGEQAEGLCAEQPPDWMSLCRGGATVAWAPSQLVERRFVPGSCMVIALPFVLRS